MSFKPPNGQSCKNCLNYQRSRCNDGKIRGFCHSLPPRNYVGWFESLDEAAVAWCGSWRGNAEVRCGACAYWPQRGSEAKGGCQRAFFGHLRAKGSPQFIGGIPLEDAFPCDRWETAP